MSGQHSWHELDFVETSAQSAQSKLVLSTTIDIFEQQTREASPRRLPKIIRIPQSANHSGYASRPICDS